MSKTEEMRALTIWQPWAAWIVYGTKRTENRVWPPPEWIIGQRIAIHAGKHFDETARYLGQTRMVGPWRMDHCAIIGTAVVSGYMVHSQEAARDPWFKGPYGWKLDSVRILCMPIPIRGMLGLWRVPHHMTAVLLENVS